MAHSYPTSKTQEKVLTALGLTANDFSDAERIFSKIGISVGSKRVGRSTEPVISRLPAYGGGWNAGGDGDIYEISYKQIDLSLISQWMQQ